MLTYLYAQGCEIDVDEFDAEEAIYWFASDYHSGQTRTYIPLFPRRHLSPAQVAADLNKIAPSQISIIY